MAGKKLGVGTTLFAAGLLAIAGGVALDKAAPALDGVTITLSGGETLRIGRILPAGGLIGAALAQSGDFTLENVEFVGEQATYSFPTIAFSGVDVPRAEIEAVFAGGDAEEIWRLLARLSAVSISAPELVAAQTIGDQTQSVVYRGLEARDVVDGRIGALTMEGGTFNGREGDQRMEGSFGAGSMTGFDLAFMLRFYTQAAGDGPNEFVRVHDGASIEDIVIGDGEGFEMAIALMTTAELDMRLLRRPFPETMRILDGIDDRDDLTPEETRASLEFVSDLFGAFAAGPMEAIDVSIEATGEEPVSVTVASVAFDPTGGLGFTGLRIDGIEGETPRGSFSIQRIASEGFSLEPVFDGMRRIAEDPSLELDPDMMQRMFPVIGTTTITGLVADAVPQGPGSEVNVRLGALSMTADAPFNGLPTNVRFSIANLAFDLPENSGQDFVEQMRGFGYERLDLSGALAARWNETANEVVLSEVSFGGSDIGSVSLRGVLGGVDAGLFSADDDQRMSALFSAAVKNAHLMFENDGIVERVLAMQAADMDSTVEDVAQQFGAMAEGFLPGMLGGGEQARALGRAIGAFINSPGELEISAQAREPEGVPVFELMQASSPASVMQQIDVTATAR